MNPLRAAAALLLFFLFAAPWHAAAQTPIEVALPNLDGLAAGDTVEVPVTLGRALNAGDGVFSYNLTVQPDTSVLQFTGEILTEGTASEGAAITTNVQESGALSLAYGGTSALTGGPPLVILEATAVGGGTSPLAFTEFVFNEGSPAAATEDGSAEVDHVLINEVDYDQPSTDTAEFIELYNAGSAPVSLGSYVLVLVNGANGDETKYLLPSDNLPAGGYYVICDNPAAVPGCDFDARADATSNLIQNGAPDAVGLRNGNAVLVDAVSYEGNTPDYTEGEGVSSADNNDTPDLSIGRLPDGEDTNNNDADFAQVLATPGASNTIFPVELADFTAQADGEAVLLRWQTASETSNAGFQVQLRRPGQDAFADVERGFVPSNAPGGTTLEAQQYRFRVAGLLPGTYHFRLKQTDFDGAFEHSPVVEAVVAPRLSLRAYPNPFRTEAQIELSVPASQDVKVEVYNVLGQRVALLHDGPADAAQALRPRLSAAGLASGLYLVRVQGETFAAVRRLTLVR